MLVNIESFDMWATKLLNKGISMGAVTAGIVKNSEYHIKGKHKSSIDNWSELFCSTRFILAQNVGTQVAGSINNPGIQSVDSQTAVDIQNTQNNGKRSVIQLRNLSNLILFYPALLVIILILYLL